MSSLAAARADNFYFPPEWRPEYGGISKYQGSKGANQYQQYGIIRFELPFDGWCLKCGRHMSKGLRFNAKKDRDGKYFSTTIYKFTMKCYSCDQEFIIRTNPKESTYDFAEGLRKMEQDYVAERSDSLIDLKTDEEKFAINNDPILKLQHEEEDKRIALQSKEQLNSLFEMNNQVKNDFAMNSLLRKKNRQTKQHSKSLLEEGKKRGLSIPLLEESISDHLKATEVFQKKAKKSRAKENEKLRKVDLAFQPIFGTVSDQHSNNNIDHRSNNKRARVESSQQKKNRIQESAMKKMITASIDISNFVIDESRSSSSLLNLSSTPSPPMIVTSRPRKRDHSASSLSGISVNSSQNTSKNALSLLNYSDSDSDSDIDGNGNNNSGNVNCKRQMNSSEVSCSPASSFPDID